MAARSVDEYLASLVEPQRGLARALVDSVLQAAPELRGCIKWSQPVFEAGGPCCWIKAHKAHVCLGFWRGRQLEAGQGVLEGSGRKMAHLKLRSLGDLRPDLVRALVQEAVALNRERGDPTKGD